MLRTVLHFNITVLITVLICVPGHGLLVGGTLQ